jgi:hypothetical protein
MARIGLVLYWMAKIVAAGAGTIAVISAVFSEAEGRFLIAGLLCAFGLVVWLLGYCCWKALADQPIPQDRAFDKR